VRVSVGNLFIHYIAMDCVDANIKKAGNTVERLAYPASGTKAFIKLEGYSLSYGA